MNSILNSIETVALELSLCESATIYAVINKESAEVQSSILQHLPPKKSGEILKLFPKESQLLIIKSMSLKNPYDPQALLDSLKIVLENASRLSGLHANKKGGIKNVAQILLSQSGSQISSTLKEISNLNPALAEEIKSHLWTFQNLIKIRKEDLYKVLAKISDKDLSLALRKCDVPLKDLLLQAVSKNRADSLVDLVENSKKVPISDIEASQKLIADAAKKMIDSGEILDPQTPTA